MREGAEVERSALVTGGSRGVGAATCVALARRGYDIVVTYRNKAGRAASVVSSVEALGRRALAVQADITDPDKVRGLSSTVEKWAGKLDALVLNASGGLERDLLAVDPDYPMRINRDAQVAVLNALLPRIRAGGTVVFVTSHWAHLYPEVVQLPQYEVVARSKYAGELALRDRISNLDRLSIRLVVVTGDMVEGTITARMLERVAPGLMSSRKRSIRALPTTEDMAEAIARTVADARLESGGTVVVGGGLDSIPRKVVDRSLT